MSVDVVSPTKLASALREHWSTATACRSIDEQLRPL